MQPYFIQVNLPYGESTWVNAALILRMDDLGHAVKLTFTNGSELDVRESTGNLHFKIAQASKVSD